MIGSSAPVQRLSPPARLRRLLAAAGEPGGLRLADWLVVKVAVSLCALVAVLAGPGLTRRTGVLLVLGALVAGFLAPDLWLARRGRRRMEVAIRDLPDMLDLFCVSVEAGLPPGRAVGTVAAQFRGPLAREWRRVAAESALGGAQEQAWASLAERLPAEEIRSLAAAMTRAQRHGAPLGRVLAGQASRARHRRRQSVRERAARAGPKIQLVVALLLVPSVLLMVTAALLAELQRSGLALPA